MVTKASKIPVKSERKKFVDIKARIFELEKDNDRYVYVFRSTKDWWKIGGNSALYYKYIIASRIKKKINIIADRDHYSTFKTGVVSVRDLDALKKNMEKASLELREENQNAMRFEFDKPVEPETIRSIKKEIEVRGEMVNKLVETEVVVPKMYTATRDASKRIWFLFANHSNGFSRTVLGPRVIGRSQDMMRTYSQMANGMIGVEDGLHEIMLQANDLISDLAFLYETENISFERFKVIQDLLGEVKHIARNKLTKIKREREK